MEGEGGQLLGRGREVLREEERAVMGEGEGVGVKVKVGGSDKDGGRVARPRPSHFSTLSVLFFKKKKYLNTINPLT